MAEPTWTEDIYTLPYLSLAGAFLAGKHRVVHQDHDL
jgi:hypothetical protein